MVVDTSAIVAVLLGDREAASIAEALERSSTRLISAVTRVELSCVIEGRKGEQGRQALDQFLATADVEVAAVTAHQADLAIEAFRRFGKGRHPAGLDLGDCFSYALAMATDHPLLFKGDDFGRTDVRAVLWRGEHASSG